MVRLVQPLDHHPRLALGARVAHQHPAVGAQRALGARRWPSAPWACPRSGCLSRDREVEQHLRVAGHRAGQLGQRPALLDHHRQHPQRRQDAVAGGRVIQEDQVARLLAAQQVAGARASPRPRSDRPPRSAAACRPLACSARSSPRLDITVATTVRPGSSSLASMRVPRMAMISSPSTTRPFSSHRITRSASPSSATPSAAPNRRTSSARRLGVQRAAAVVDVPAVGLHAQLDHLGAQLVEHLGRDLVGRAVGAVDHDPHAVQGRLRGEGVLQELDVAARRRPRCAWPCRCSDGPLVVAVGLHQALDLGLDLVGQLEPVAGEELDAVVLVGVVRGADDHAGVGAHRRGDERDARRGQRPHQQHVGARRDDARLERALQHVARQPGVLADHDAPLCGRRRTGGPPPAPGAGPPRRSSGAGWPRRGCRRYRTGCACRLKP